MEQKMSEITAELVGEWIDNLNSVHPVIAHKAFRDLADNVELIAKAYLAKCEEVDQMREVKDIFVKKWSAEEDSALALERENKRLQSEFEQFKAHSAQMMVNQMSAFEIIQEENIQLRKAALALTQQQTGGAV